MAHYPVTSTSINLLQNVLVTGGCGFLGAHIVKRLLNDVAGAPAAVAIVSRHASARVGQEFADQSTTYHSVDIADDAAVAALFERIKPHVVIHISSPKNTSSAGVLQRTNVEGTKVLLKHAKSYKDTRAFVYTSSDSAQRPSQELLTEDKAQLWDDMTYNNPYGRAKAAAENLVLAANGADLRTATLRIPTIYGENDSNFVPRIVASMRKGEHTMQLGNNEKLFEFLNVESAAEAHVLAAKALLRPGEGIGPNPDGEAYFITDGKAIPFFDFMRKCYAAGGAPVKPEEVRKIPLGVIQVMASVGEWAYWIFTLGMRQPEMRRHEIDHLDAGCNWSIDKARVRLGYQPLLDQDAAIEKTMKWAMENINS
ncbi:MAG: hypothetical protein M1820_008165 [Bogoriella megaspora]|nr:MAG: hypothetical protein M1820_008165 [Bogoriella megaspora]